MDEDCVVSFSSAEPPIPATKFEEPELLTKKQFSEYWSKFPYPVRKAVNKTKRGELKPVSDEDLLQILLNYFEKKPDVSAGECEGDQRAESPATSVSVD